jgi:LemA protein
MTLTIILLGLLGTLTVLFLGAYNQLVRSRNRVREAWSGIDLQLRRRASLIPNLIDAVQAYAHHERATLEHVASARGALQHAGGAGEAASANQVLTQALGRLFAVVESYPQLRASENFAKLQTELSDIEEKIAFARQFYNRNVLDYNNRIDVVPTVVVARALDFHSAEFFDAGEEGRQEVRGGFTFTAATSRTPTAPPAG